MKKEILFNLISKCDSNIKQGGLRCSGYFKENKENEPLITIITTIKNGDFFF